MVKNLPAMQETQVQSLGQENPLEKRMATHSSILGACLVVQMVKKKSVYYVGNLGLIPGSGRSLQNLKDTYRRVMYLFDYEKYPICMITKTMCGITI